MAGVERGSSCCTVVRIIIVVVIVVVVEKTFAGQSELWQAAASLKQQCGSNQFRKQTLTHYNILGPIHLAPGGVNETLSPATFRVVMSPQPLVLALA